MDSGTSGGSMQSGSSGEDDQNDTSFSPSPLSIPSLNLHHQNLQAQGQGQAHLHHQQQPIFSSQHLHLYPPLTNTTRDHHDHMINPYHHQPASSHNSFLETLPQSDLDRIWSMGLNSHPQSHQQQQNDNHHHNQQMFYSASSSSAMNQNTQPSPQDNPQQKLQPTGKLSTQPGKENGSLSSGRVVKKRTRASRKTPTTVLTTDTTNFRAMVQEFTGIPTPPFGPSPLFPAKKFDLFNSNNSSLDPSLGSLLFSLNKAANNNNNPNPNPFAPPPHPPLITTTTTAPLSTNPNHYHHHQQQQPSEQMRMMMMPSGSNSNLLYVNMPQGQNQNPNLAFQQTSLRASKYSGNEQVEVDQQGGYSKGDNDNFSGTG